MDDSIRKDCINTPLGAGGGGAPLCAMGCKTRNRAPLDRGPEVHHPISDLPPPLSQEEQIPKAPEPQYVHIGGAAGNTLQGGRSPCCGLPAPDEISNSKSFKCFVLYGPEHRAVHSIGVM